MIPLFTKSTRLVKNSKTLIENIFTNFTLDKDIYSAVIEEKLSDHYPGFCLIDSSTNLNKLNNNDNNPLFKRFFTEETYELINRDIDLINWDVLTSMKCNDACNYFIDKLATSINERAPFREIKRKKGFTFHDPWITTGLLVSSHKLKTLYKKCKNKPPEHPNCINYTIYRNKFNSIKRQAKINYHHNKFKLYYRDIKKTWNVVNSVIGSKK